MNVSDVMDELAGALASIPALAERTFAYPAPGVVPPAAMVGWPDQIDYDVTMARGAWSATFPVLIAVGKADVRSARDAIGAYVSSTGASSVRAALDAGLHSAYDSARVTSARVEPVSIAGVEYLAALLDVEVTGQGGQ